MCQFHPHCREFNEVQHPRQTSVQRSDTAAAIHFLLWGKASAKPDTYAVPSCPAWLKALQLWDGSYNQVFDTSSWEAENWFLSPSHHRHHNPTVTETGTHLHDGGAYTTSTISKRQLLIRADVATYIHKEYLASGLHGHMVNWSQSWLRWKSKPQIFSCSVLLISSDAVHHIAVKYSGNERQRNGSWCQPSYWKHDGLTGCELCDLGMILSHYT